MTEQLTLAVAQFACSSERAHNVEVALNFIKKAAAVNAALLILPELFEHPYFPIERHADEYFSYATTLTHHPYLAAFQEAARHHNVAVPFSFFERYDPPSTPPNPAPPPHYYNTLAWIDATGEVTGIYRKTHLPTGPGYEEDYYFTAGAQIPNVVQPQPPAPSPAPPQPPPAKAFHVFPLTKNSSINVGAAICWDQWFPEVARLLALQHADIIVYPSAIGSEPLAAGFGRHYSSQKHWQRVICGHAAANTLPVAAANRIGTEKAKNSPTTLTFYGSSFIADASGKCVTALNAQKEGMVHHTFDLAAIRKFRHRWGLLQSRRPDLYNNLTLKWNAGLHASPSRCQAACP